MSAHDVRRNAKIGFAVVAVFSVPIWFLLDLLDRTPPYTFEHVEIQPAEVQRGGEISVTFTVKQNRPPCGPGLVYREFKEVRSSKLHPFDQFDPVLRTETPVVVDDKFTRKVVLSESLPPGPTIYRGKSCYACKPIQSWLRLPVCAITPPAEFTIIENPNAGVRQ